MNSFFPGEESHRQNYVVDPQRLEISELQFDKLSHIFTVFMLEDKIQNPSTEAILWNQEVEMVDSVDDSRTARSI